MLALGLQRLCLPLPQTSLVPVPVPLGPSFSEPMCPEQSYSEASSFPGLIVSPQFSSSPCSAQDTQPPAAVLACFTLCAVPAMGPELYKRKHRGSNLSHPHCQHQRLLPQDPAFSCPGPEQKPKPRFCILGPGTVGTNTVGEGIYFL